MRFRMVMGTIPLLLTGCMMLGSNGMGHGSGGDMPHQVHGVSGAGHTLVKEVVGDGMRITAEFPPYAVGDSVRYRVTVRRERDTTVVRDASLGMSVTLVSAREEATRISASSCADGTCIFRPEPRSAGAYRVAVYVARPGILGAPVRELEQVVQVAARPQSMMPEGGHAQHIRFAPAALLGVSVMAGMMLLMVR